MPGITATPAPSLAQKGSIIGIHIGDRVTSLTRHGTFQVIRSEDFSHLFLLEDEQGNQFWISKLAVEKASE